MDQISRLYMPAYFVQDLKIWQGDELLLAMEGSIGISEDPNIRFSYVPNGTQAFRVEVVDTDNRVVQGRVAVRSAGDVAIRRDDQKQRTSASAWARRRSLVAVLACSGERNMVPNSPGDLGQAQHRFRRT